MDYKDLVQRLNAYSAEYQYHGGITAEAADAIETLIAERDAAIDALNYGGCSTCKYQNLGYDSKPCMFCYQSRGTSGNWEWKGPQEGGRIK